MAAETTSMIASNAVTKGDVLAAARIAGIQAAKRTADMIPLCHPLLVGAVNINFNIGDDNVEVEAQVETVDRTGVEMEAMHAATDRGAHDLRHVQVDGPRHGHRRPRAMGKDRRALRPVAPPDSPRRTRAHC